MQAIETEAEVGDDHAIHVQIPDDWVTAKVKVIIIQQPEELNFTSKKSLKLGLFKGQIEMSEDFDDELPDEFWLGGTP